MDHHPIELKFESIFPLHQILPDFTFDSQGPFSVSPWSFRSLDTVVSRESGCGEAEPGPDPTLLCECCCFWVPRIQVVNSVLISCSLMKTYKRDIWSFDSPSWLKNKYEFTLELICVGISKHQGTLVLVAITEGRVVTLWSRRRCVIGAHSCKVPGLAHRWPLPVLGPISPVGCASVAQWAPGPLVWWSHMGQQHSQLPQLLHCSDLGKSVGKV